jgi:hypothetical protein
MGLRLVMRENGKLYGVSMCRSLRWIMVACALAVGLVACSGGSTTSKPASSPSPTSASPTSGSSASGSAAEQEIATNWAAFFNAATPADKRVSLLQDGQAFASVIKAQQGTGLASQASATVSKVTVTKPASQAAVDYSILIAGKPALSNQSGTAVYQGGTWKVGVSSFCGLLALENGGSTASLPAACKTAA